MINPRTNAVSAMIRGKCPICFRGFSAPCLDVLPYFPFCSKRCCLFDLGKWVEGSYLIPGAALTDVQFESSDEIEQDEE